MFNKFSVTQQTIMGKSANGNSKSLAKLTPLLVLIYVSLTASGQTSKPTKANSSALTAIESKIRDKTMAIESKLIGWRRDIHQNPELGDQEERTSKLVAEHLRTLGIEVQTGVGGTGVVGILKGGKPGKLVALRADMDALAVKEPAGLPFASKATAQINGKTEYLMHACGHDAHTAMLMAAAEVLA
ncbi:M20/M25/M40 family metallo-hydrolase, partial [Dyadobacter sp. CY327]|uniref:M20/M25/M40 family metallo-hydrolase n=1 Tax=Dyadobacter sp. CY327 TaxID=2907301 RepID=UPI001F1E1E80